MANFECLKANEAYVQYWAGNHESKNPMNVDAKEKHDYRSVFAYDRDRVMYCTAFRRLAAKTQVFNSQTSDHLRTRLTHTLEVAQIARTISHALGLDEDLTEAIALGHDVGHTPFGHVGERTLHRFSCVKDESQTGEKAPDAYSPYSGFKHNLQSVRVLVESPENLRFSNYMLFGIREHTDIGYKENKIVNPTTVQFYNIYDRHCSYKSKDTDTLIPAWSFEAYVVKWADHIAQRHHDFEDAFLQKIMTPTDIVETLRPLYTLAEQTGNENKHERIRTRFDRLTKSAQKFSADGNSDAQYSFIHTLSSFVIDAYVTFFIDEFRGALVRFINDHNIQSRSDFETEYPHINVDEIRGLMTTEFKKAAIVIEDDSIGKSIVNNILRSHNVQWMDGKGEYTIRKIVCAYLKNPQLLPDRYVRLFVQIELPRVLTVEVESNKGKNNLLHKLMENKKISNIFSRISGTISPKTSIFHDILPALKSYECREILQLIHDDEAAVSIPGFRSKAYCALVRVVCDYIAGMTDSYASDQFASLYR